MTSASDYALSLRSRQSTSSNAEPNVSVLASTYGMYLEICSIAYFVKFYLLYLLIFMVTRR